jgi:hypothetical protein
MNGTDTIRRWFRRGFRRGRLVEVDGVKIEKPILFQEERSETGSILA